MPYYIYDSKNIYYNVFDNKKKENLLLLHGNCVSHKMFRSEIKYYSQFYNVIVFDYPGIGLSERIEQFRDDYWNYNAKCCIEILDMLKIKCIKAIGTSGGALTGLNVTALDPNRFVAFVADSFMGFGLTLEDSLTIGRRRRKAKTALLQVAFWKDMIGEDWSSVVDQDIDLMERVGSKRLLTIHGDLSKVLTPILCVSAETDELIPNTPDKVKAVADKLPKSRNVVYDYGKHPFMITQKPEFRKLALEFLNEFK